MASTLPNPNACCTPCDDPTVVNIPGPAGANGSNGTNGTNGSSAYTTFTAGFTIPAELSAAAATVADTSWMAIGMKVYGARLDGSVHAIMQVTNIAGATTVTLKNLKDTPSSAYLENSAPATTLNVGSKLCVTGIQGPAVNPSGAAGGDLKGTYPNPKLSIGNNKGSLCVGNGTDTIGLAVGSDGKTLIADSTAINGVSWNQEQPITGDANVAANRLPVLSAAVGKPIPLIASKVSINSNGAIQSDGTGGNARGIDATDLQTDRTAAGVTAVASGSYSTICGGRSNTASGGHSVIPGGEGNSAINNYSTVGGGASNTSSGQSATISGGSGNTASTRGSTIGGGEGNVASTGNRATVGGGQNNTASAQEATVAGGNANVASNTQATVGGGDSNNATGNESTIAGGGGNAATGTNSTVSGGQNNDATGDYASVPGGLYGIANHYGEVAHANGRFAADGDAQTMELVFRATTTDATPTELFLDGSGATQRATIPNNTSWFFHARAIARESGGDSAFQENMGGLRNTGGTTGLIGTVQAGAAQADAGAGWNGASPTTAVVYTADNANDSLKITVTGEAAITIRWVVYVRIVQVSH